MEIKCFLIANGEFIVACITQEQLIELSQIIREKGAETVQLSTRSVLVEGIYIPAKGTNTMLMAMPKTDENKAVSG